MNKLSYKNQLLLYFVILIIIITIIIEITSYLLLSHYFYKEAEKNFISKVDVNMNYFYKYIDFSKGIENVIKEDSSIIFQYSLGNIKIYNTSGELLLSSGDEFGSNLDVNKVLPKISEKNQLSFYDDKDNYSFIIIRPLMFGNEIVGLIEFDISMMDTNTTIQYYRNIILFISIMGMFLSIGIAYIFSRIIIKPINTIKIYANELAQGNYNTNIQKIGPEETQQLCDTLDNLRMEIIKRDNITNEFIANISHELKTPLTSIKGWAYTILEDIHDVEILQEGITIIDNETERLTSLVNDLLDFSRLASNRMVLKKQKNSVNELLKNIELQFIPRSITENKTLIIQMLNKDIEIFIDPLKIKQVLLNLLDNAFKFTSIFGKIMVYTIIKEKYIDIIVKDDGEGISPDDINHIFEKFYRGNSKNSHVGLGLSIASEIMELHGGKLSVNSEYKKGSEFIVSIPLKLEEDNMDEV